MTERSEMEHQDWDRAMFQALTSRALSRNKYYATFAQGMFRAIHRRFRTVDGLRREAERLAALPGSTCRISEDGEGLRLHLNAPMLSYRREIDLRAHEWDWLTQQEGIRKLLERKPADG